MPLTVYFDADADPAALRGRRIGLIGYGNQGRAQALNLRDSGCDVAVGLRPESPSRARALEDGIETGDVGDVVADADLVAVMAPDEAQPNLYATHIAPRLRAGQTLLFCHGFAIHFGLVSPPPDVGVILVAPKGPGLALREAYLRGHGLPGLYAVHQDPDGTARERALAYAHAIGCTRAGVFETSFREETECDLFGEQTVLCGGLSHLVAAAFETLVEAGYDPVMAWFECLYEVKLTADLIHARGIAGMREAISNTAEFGDHLVGPAVVDDHVRERLRDALENIRSGTFARTWMAEYKAGSGALRRSRERQAGAQIDEVGRTVRHAFRLQQEATGSTDQP